MEQVKARYWQLIKQRQEEERRRREQARQQRAWEDFWREAQGSAVAGGCTTVAWREVLGVPATATMDQVKARYRQLAKQHHPDFGGEKENFMRVQEAYEQAMRDLEGR
jgi:DnaJ-domain-containing protein 1